MMLLVYGKHELVKNYSPYFEPHDGKEPDKLVCVALLNLKSQFTALHNLLFQHFDI